MRKTTNPGYNLSYQLYFIYKTECFFSDLKKERWNKYKLLQSKFYKYQNEYCHEYESSEGKTIYMTFTWLLYDIFENGMPYNTVDMIHVQMTDVKSLIVPRNF